MSALETYKIGRDKSCDVVISDRSVSRHHAELTIAKSGKYYLTDCKSNNGTFVGRGGKWVPIEQDFIKPKEVLLIGRHQTTATQLLAGARRRRAPEAAAGVETTPERGRGPGGGDPGKGLPSGPVRRDPGTGDIIKADGE